MNNFLRDLQEVLDTHGATISITEVNAIPGFEYNEKFAVQFNLGVHEGDRYPTYTDEVNISDENKMSSKYRIFDGV